MNNNFNFRPNWASVPGNTISAILANKNYSIDYFAEKINVSPEFAIQLINGNEQITPEIAAMLSNNLGSSKEFWLRREKQYRTQVKKIHSLSSKTEDWLRTLPIKEMIRIGWIQDTPNIVDECLKFFDMPDIISWEKKYSNLFTNISFRKSKTYQSDLGTTAAWLRKGEILGNSIKSDEYSENKLEASIPELKKLTRKKNPIEFIPELKSICASCGIILLILKTPTGCKASGATLFLKDGRPLILLSLRYYSDDHFWFTFFHEIGHIMLHRIRKIYIELGNTNYDIDNEEKEANLFAEEVLIPGELHAELYKLKGNKRNIISFAIKAGVSPGIVIGQMQYKGIIDYKYLNSYKRRFDWESINGTP